MRVYSVDGDSIASFGQPLRSWLDAPQPERGAFVGVGGMARAQEWLNSFTVVAGIFPLKDSLLVVQYGRHEPEPTEMYAIRRTTVDVYDRHGRKILEDIAFAKRILGGGEHFASWPTGWNTAKRIRTCLPSRSPLRDRVAEHPRQAGTRCPTAHRVGHEAPDRLASRSLARRLA
jgi:hypothetical protein